MITFDHQRAYIEETRIKSAFELYTLTDTRRTVVASNAHCVCDTCHLSARKLDRMTDISGTAYEKWRIQESPTRERINPKHQYQNYWVDNSPILEQRNSSRTLIGTESY